MFNHLKPRIKDMKRTITLALAIFMALISVSAQSYRRGTRNIVPASPYYHDRAGHYFGYDHIIRPYFGLRIGPAFTNVRSEDGFLDGSGIRTGVNVGIAAGFPVSPFTPLYFETGLTYTEKGGTGKASSGKFTYRLNYLELPFVFKYKAHLAPGFSLQPYAGGYAAVGVGGKIKDFHNRTAYSSFSSSSSDSFRRGDAGLRFGCGLEFHHLYFDVAYDLGLSNITRDGFDSAHNNSVMLNFGLNF